MYLKKIAIKNIGPIDNISIELPFYENNNPKPIVFVGENGSGKTILQSQIIDSFYEIGSDLFSDIGKKNGLERNYYKISGGLNLKSGTKNGFSALVFYSKNKEKIEYLDKIGSLEDKDITDLISDFTLSQDNKIDNQKKITSFNAEEKEKLMNEWIEGVHFYQPAYRYEEPFWKNNIFLDFQRFEEKIRFSNELKKEIEIISSTKDNKSYLLDLVLDYEIQKKPVDILIWENVKVVLQKIKKRNDIRFGIGPRGSYRVAIVEQNPDGSQKSMLLKSIDNLSLGESILLNLFLNIIRHGDGVPKKLNEIEGIVAIDEIDVHLHTDLQNSVLPELIKVFPKIQFIITTHSPLFLLGMEKFLGKDGFEIINMPSGNIITTERFSEFQNAYDILKETERFESEINQKIEKTTKNILFVEGDYDIRYINKALELFNKSEMINSIEIYDANGFGGLDKIWKSYDSKLSEVIPQKILLLYDCDTNKQDSIRDSIIKKVIPTIQENIIKIGIENLFSNETIQKARIYKKDMVDYTPEIKREIRGVEIIESEKYEINKDEKSNLCDWICQNGTIDDFKNFDKMFEIINDNLLLKTIENQE